MVIGNHEKMQKLSDCKYNEHKEHKHKHKSDKNVF